MPKPLLIAKTGSTFTGIRSRFGDFDDWFVARFRRAGVDTQVVDVSLGAGPGDAEQYAGVVVTGSPAMVSDREPWSEALAQWLREAAADIPILGVCYGHQLLAHAFGGEVNYHPQGREIGTHAVELRPAATDDLLFGGFPEQFKVHLTHAQSVLRLPERAVHLAANPFEPNQAFRIGQNVWGVQFHPEFSPAVMSAYIESFRPKLEEEGMLPDRLLAEVEETPWAESVLDRFAKLVSA